MRKNVKTEVKKNGKPKFKILENLKPGTNVVYNGNAVLKITNVYKDIAIGCTAIAGETFFTVFLTVPTKEKHMLANDKMLEAGKYITGSPNVDIRPISISDTESNQRHLANALDVFDCGEDFLRNRYEIKSLTKYESQV